jgi:hypothetical protein
MLNDDVVDEVRAVREAHAARFNYDLRAIYDDLKKSETARIAAGHPFVLPPSHSETPSAFRGVRFAHA